MTADEEAYVDALKLQIEILTRLLETTDVNVIANMREKAGR